MARRDMKKKLGASIKAEEDAFKSRFEKAETVLGRKQPAHRNQEQGAAKPDKVIRDSFTMPASDYELISQIKSRCLKTGTSVNKSEVLRAGLAALDAMSEKELRAVIGRLTKVKTGRPAAKAAA